MSLFLKLAIIARGRLAIFLPKGAKVTKYALRHRVPNSNTLVMASSIVSMIDILHTHYRGKHNPLDSLGPSGLKQKLDRPDSRPDSDSDSDPDSSHSNLEVDPSLDPSPVSPVYSSILCSAETPANLFITQ